MKNLGRLKLRGWLYDRRVAVAELARRVGVSRQALHNWINGQSIPGIAAAVALERVTDGWIEVADWIADGDDPRQGGGSGQREYIGVVSPVTRATDLSPVRSPRPRERS